MEGSIRMRHIRISGFTLAESLVALVIGLLVMVGLHQMFAGSLTAQTTASSQMEVDRQAQVAMDNITFWLRGSGAQGPVGPPYGVLEAYPDRICFTDQSGANTVRYWLDAGQLRHAFNAKKYSGGTVLATSVTRLAFTYFDRNGLPPAIPSQTVRTKLELGIAQGRNSSLLRTAVRLRNI